MPAYLVPVLAALGLGTAAVVIVKRRQHTADQALVQQVQAGTASASVLSNPDPKQVQRIVDDYNKQNPVTSPYDLRLVAGPKAAAIDVKPADPNTIKPGDVIEAQTLQADGTWADLWMRVAQNDGATLTTSDAGPSFNESWVYERGSPTHPDIQFPDHVAVADVVDVKRGAAISGQADSSRFGRQVLPYGLMGNARASAQATSAHEAMVARRIAQRRARDARHDTPASVRAGEIRLFGSNPEVTALLRRERY